MEEQFRAVEPPVKTEPMVQPQHSGSQSGHSVISGLLIVAALFFAGKGWYTLYDDSYDAQVVGGDAYNFIIYAARGTAFVCIGIVCAVLSVTFAVFARNSKRN